MRTGYIYARRCAARKDPILGMLALETIGYYSDKSRSQSYPFPAHGGRRLRRGCYPHYRATGDTPDKLNYLRLGEAAKGMLHVVRTLAGVY